MAASLRRVPPWAWLAAIVVASAVFRAILARGIVAPFVIVDEIIWSELARGIGDDLEPALRSEPNPGYSLVYPILLAPVYALFESLPEAYGAVKTLNAVVMSLAAVPAYFLARRVAGAALSLVAALLAVCVPSLAYTGTVMTENLFYPLFLVVALVLVLVLERPTGLRVAVLALLVGGAFATRVQAATFVPAILLAPLALAFVAGIGLRETARRYATLYGAFVLLGLVAVVARLAAGRSPDEVLGAYEPVGEASYEVGEVLRYTLWHAAELTLYLLVVPVAVSVLLVLRARSLDRPLQEMLAATLALTASFVPVVAAFASAFSERIEERNMFYLAPLFVVLLVAWIERGAFRPRLASVAAALACALLVLAIPLDRFLATPAITDTLMLLPIWSLQDRIGADWIELATLALAASLACAFLLVPRRYALALPLLLAGLWLVALRPIWFGTHGFERFSEGVLFQGIRTSHRDWVDRALPRGAVAAFVWTGRTDPLTVHQNEFFSRGVGRVYYLDERTPGLLPETQVSIDPRTGAVMLPDGEPVTDEYVVADATFEPAGRRIALDVGWGVGLWKVDPPLVSATRVDGLYPNDTWSGKTVTYVRRRCVPGRLVVELASDGTLFFEPQTVVARMGGGKTAMATLPPGGQVALLVPLAPAPGRDECRVTFTVSPTEIPARVTGGESDDERVLGAHFNSFRFVPGDG